MPLTLDDMSRCKNHELVVFEAGRRARSMKQMDNVNQVKQENPKTIIMVCVHCNHAEARKFPGQDDKMMREHNLKTK